MRTARELSNKIQQHEETGPAQSTDKCQSCIHGDEEPRICMLDDEDCEYCYEPGSLG